MPEPGDEAVRAAREAYSQFVRQSHPLAAEDDNYRWWWVAGAEWAAASERAKVEALLAVAEARHVAMHSRTPAECGDQLCAALDAVRAGRAS